jgi:peptidoglycan/xylan/chitin deacetylase (PgdA/CDA1 family)
MRRGVLLALVLVVMASGCNRTSSIDPGKANPAVSPSGSPPTRNPPIPSSSDSSPPPVSTASTPPAPTASPAPRSPSPFPVGDGVPSWLVGQDLTALPTASKVIALTFDAGANADGVPSIMATLEADGVPATFFLTGTWVQVYPALAAAIGSRYPVGNHSFTHPDLTRLSDAEVIDEVQRAASAIEDATGRDTHPMFRFPFGATDAHLISLLNSLGYGCIRWSVDTLGWEGTSGGQTVDSVVLRVDAGLQPGAIVIMHVGSNPDDGSTLDADALDRVIDEIRARGYSFVALDRFIVPG